MRTETAGVTETLIESAKKNFLNTAFKMQIFAGSLLRASKYGVYIYTLWGQGWTFFGGSKAGCRRTYGVVS